MTLPTNNTCTSISNVRKAPDYTNNSAAVKSTVLLYKIIRADGEKKQILFLSGLSASDINDIQHKAGDIWHEEYKNRDRLAIFLELMDKEDMYFHVVVAEEIVV